MPTQLYTAFNNAVGFFNNGNYNTLLQYLHDTIIMKRVDDPTSVIGVGNVIAYLNGLQAPLRPVFTPTTQTEWSPTANSDNAVHANMSGSGTYQDNSLAYTDVLGNPHLPSTAFPVQYVFTYRRKTTSDFWLLVNATARR